MRFFYSLWNAFGVCNRARLFSALFGHEVADEYANVRRDRDADCMLCTHRSKLTVTDYKPHAACHTGCERRSYTHTHTTSDINQPPSNTVGLYVNQWIDASDWFGRLWSDSVMNVPLEKKKKVECSSQISFFSEMIHFIIYQHRLLSVTF